MEVNTGHTYFEVPTSLTNEEQDFAFLAVINASFDAEEIFRGGNILSDQTIARQRFQPKDVNSQRTNMEPTDPGWTGVVASHVNPERPAASSQILFDIGGRDPLALAVVIVNATRAKNLPDTFVDEDVDFGFVLARIDVRNLANDRRW